MFFVDKMSSRLPYQTVETYIGNKTAFAEFCFLKLFSFCVKSGRKTEPWNWAVTAQFHGNHGTMELSHGYCKISFSIWTKVKEHYTLKLKNTIR